MGRVGLDVSAMNFRVDFQQQPLLLIWEVSRACALACQHCRASAIDWRDPGELSLDEAAARLGISKHRAWKMIHHHTDTSPAMLDVLRRLQPPSKKAVG